MYLKKLKIGNVELENNIILGPMAGYTDRSFRIICEKFEPGLVVTEMVSSKAIFYGDDKTNRMLDFTGEKRPISVQIFGNDKEACGYATKFICEKYHPDLIDINMGCPAPKIVKNGEGSKLLLDLDKVYEITKAVVEASSVPVTVKIRKGWDNDHIVAVDAAKVIEKAGASAITIHGRTRSEFYSGNADWDIIKQVKENVNIPVIGNGDVRSGEDALKMFKETNCDGIMISRASLGNPWIFEEVKNYLKNAQEENFFHRDESEIEEENSLHRESEIEENKNSNSENWKRKITKEEKMNIILEHIELETEEKGENVGIKEMRKHIAFYLKGEENASKLREKINHLETKEEVENEIRAYFDGKNL